MAWYVAGGLGVVGSLLVEAMDLVRLIKQNDNRLPAVFFRAGYWVAVLIRAAIGFVVAAILVGAALTEDAVKKLGLSSGAVLVLAGAGAPLIVERLLAAFLALIGQSPPPPPPGGEASAAATTGEVVGRASAGAGFGNDLTRCLIRGDWLFAADAGRTR